MKKIRHYFNLILIVSCLSVSISSNAFVDSSKNFDNYNQQAILSGINAYRSEHGLAPLKMNNHINEVARGHSQTMAEDKIPFGHIGFNERMTLIFQQFRYSRGIAENVAFTSEDPKTVVKLWLESRGHRKNIEGNFNLTGIGIAHDKKGGTYVTQIFLNTLDNKALS